MTAHVHAELMRLYYEDALETEMPWVRWEYLAPGRRSWESHAQSPGWRTDFEYRRKPTSRQKESTVTFPKQYYDEIPADKLPRVVADLVDKHGVEGALEALEEACIDLHGWHAPSLGVVCLFQEDVYRYRLKRPEPVMITRTITYPEPITEEPEHGEDVWAVDPADATTVAQITYARSSPFHRLLFRRGWLYRTKGDARARAIAEGWL